MNHKLGNPGFPLVRSTLLLCAVAGVGVALIAGVSPGLASAALVAAGACVLGGFIGLVPVWKLSALRIDGVGVGYLLGLMPRAMVAFGAAVLVSKVTNWSMPEFAAMLAAFYAVMLGAEVAMISRWLWQPRLEAERVH